MFEFLPDKAFSDIQDHLLTTVGSAERSRYGFFDKEDAITGMLLGRMEQNKWQHSNDVKWRVQVHQPGPYGDFGESTVGADGIIQIVIYGRDGKLLESKGLLFQAKKTNNRDGNIFDQIENMENAVGRNGSALFFYDKQKGFTATDASEFEGYSKKGKEFKLNELIATEFMECRIGVKGVRYDLKSKKLIRPGPDLLNVSPDDLRNRAEIVVERK